MPTVRTFIQTALLVATGLLSSFAGRAAPALPTTAPLRITVLYDAFGKDAARTKDWGYAALVQINGRRVLFDTGDDPAVLERNVKSKAVDLRTIDFVVLSHRHSDHVGGLILFAPSDDPKVKIYAPKEAFGIFGSDLPSSFYRKDESLPADMRYYGGSPPENLKFGTTFPGANIQLIDKTTEVASGITLIALVSDSPGTKELKELSLAIDTPDGIVLVVGCSHPGIEAIVAEAAKINPHIHFIAGGMHLVGSPERSHRKGRHRAARHVQSRLHRPRPLHRRTGLRRPAGECSATAIFTRAWGRRSRWGRIHERHRIGARPPLSTKAIGVLIGCSPERSSSGETTREFRAARQGDRSSPISRSGSRWRGSHPRQRRAFSPLSS